MMGSEFLPSLSILWKPTNGGEARLLQSLLSQRWHDERSSSFPLLPVSSRSGSVFHEGICRERERSTNDLSISDEHREKCLEQSKWKRVSFVLSPYRTTSHSSAPNFASSFVQSLGLLAVPLPPTFSGRCRRRDAFQQPTCLVGRRGRNSDREKAALPSQRPPRGSGLSGFG